MDAITVNIAEKAAKDASEKIASALRACLTEKNIGNTILADTIRYALSSDTIQIRPSLVMGFCRLFGGRDEAAIPFACALECAVAAAQIQGDLPAINDNELRDGRPTCSTKFGEAEALLAGNSLLSLSFELLSSNQYVSHKSIRLATATLSEEIGIRGLIGSYITEQYGKLSNYSDLRKFYLRKTATIGRAACLLGYYAACDRPSSKDIANVKLYAEAISIASQIRADITGKNQDSNINVLSFLKPNEAEEEEALLTLLAIEAISDYPGSELLCKQAIWLLSK